VVEIELTELFFRKKLEEWDRYREKITDLERRYCKDKEKQEKLIEQII